MLLLVEDVVVFELLCDIVGDGFKIVVLMLLCMVNFDDVDLLWLELNIIFEWVLFGKLILCDVDLVVLFGMKFMFGDFVFFCL